MDVILNELKLENNHNYFPINYKSGNLTNILVSTEWQSPRSDGLIYMHYSASEFFKIFSSKFNVSYTNYEKAPNHMRFFKEGNVDIILTDRSLDQYLYSYAVSPWIKDENNLAFISLLHPMHKSFIKQMMNSFALITWLLIVVSVIGVTFTLYINDKYKKRSKNANLGKIFLVVISYLLNQSLNRKNKFLALSIWTLMALVLVSCFTGLILFHILFRPMKTINTLDELIDTNLTLVAGSISFIEEVNRTLDEQKDQRLVKLLQNRKLILITDWDGTNGSKRAIDFVLKNMVYVREGCMIDSALNLWPQSSERIAIAKERYFQQLIGFAINKNYTKVRGKIYQILEHSVEAGISIKYTNYKTFHEKIIGQRMTSEDEDKETNIKLNVIRDMFILIATGWTSAFIILFFEKVYQLNTTR